jgi:hypothetical protein
VKDTSEPSDAHTKALELAQRDDVIDLAS